VEWNDDVLEEYNVLISQRYSKSTDYASQNIEELSSTIEFVVFMDQGEEALVDGFTNHFSSWYEFGVQLMQNVLEVVSLYRLLRIEQFQKLLNELWSDIDFQRSNFN
jgi:hypothetical protein